MRAIRGGGESSEREQKGAAEGGVGRGEAGGKEGQDETVEGDGGERMGEKGRRERE